MLDLIHQYVPADLLAAIIAFFVAVGAVLSVMAKFVGTMTAIVAVLKRYVPRLQAWADRTECTTDNALVGIIATFLAMAAPKLEALKTHLELWAGNRFLNERVVKAEKAK
jgi:hypothetical protein